MPSSSTDQTARPAPSLTPKRPLSSTPKKYKAPLSTDAKTRSHIKAASLNVTNLGAPSPKSPSRPRTPATPRKGAESPSLLPAASEMDVSNVDIEDVLVDYQTIDPGDGDISGELDEEWVRNTLLDLEKDEEKVMVSIRLRSWDGPSAFLPPSSTTLTINQKYSKATSAAPTIYSFPLVHTSPSTKPLYLACGRPLVHAAMAGYNALIFAYGQTASGKTYTLSGDPAGTEPGIIPRAMRDVFACIRRTEGREYLLRCSYLEIYNESIYDLLAPPEKATKTPVQIVGAGGVEVVLTPLREEVVTSLTGVMQVLQRGDGNRRTACTDWNERSSRSHSVFRMVIESRERSAEEAAEKMARARSQTPGPEPAKRSYTPGPGQRSRTPAPGNGRSQTPGPGAAAGPKLQARGGKSVRVSVLSLIDLAGSEKATSDKERTKEGKYINTSLLTLGTVIGTLADNAAKRKTDHVPYRNSKLTRLLQPSLSGNARISVVCTLNPDPAALAESLSTLGFARRVGGVKLNAQKREVEDTEALIERYRKEITDLKARLAEREREVIDAGRRGSFGVKRRLSHREQMDESKAMRDLQSRIQQLTKLILTSKTVELKGADDGGEDGSVTAPGSPVKVDFDMNPYQLQQELLAARIQMESQAREILSLEEALEAARHVAEKEVLPALSMSHGVDEEKERVIESQAKRIEELEGLARGRVSRRSDVGLLVDERARKEMENRIRGEVERRVREEMEKEWKVKLKEETRRREEKEAWAKEVVRQLEMEKKLRTVLEDERRALTTFVSKFDSLSQGFRSLSSSFTSSIPSSSSSSTTLVSSPSSSSSVTKVGVGPSFGALHTPHRPLLNKGWNRSLTPPLEDEADSLPNHASKQGVVRTLDFDDRMNKHKRIRGSSAFSLASTKGIEETEIMREEMPREEHAWDDVSFEGGMEDDEDEVHAILVGSASDATSRLVGVLAGASCPPNGESGRRVALGNSNVK